ncbi:MarR family winged helix-turn-helix transcriptional regulator [Planktotalea sp.]|uniref:MarR family winged helix-turn-helix transcriptional regulator n=1 Tax=Planktotalea sp. TaxID=2029877 RepID=UPI003D6A2252
MIDEANALAVMLLSEILTTDQLLRTRLGRVLPKGMEISHFSVLNQLASQSGERTPAQLAKSMHLTRGAMTNTLGKLEWAGYIHIRPDWDDARRKLVSLSPAGRAARDAALVGMEPVIAGIVSDMGSDKIRTVLPIIRELRLKLE